MVFYHLKTKQDSAKFSILPNPVLFLFFILPVQKNHSDHLFHIRLFLSRNLPFTGSQSFRCVYHVPVHTGYGITYHQYQLKKSAQENDRIFLRFIDSQQLAHREPSFAISTIFFPTAVGLGKNRSLTSPP